MAPVVHDVERIASALRGTILEGHRLVPAIGGTVVVEGVDPGSRLQSWQAARDAMPATGRRPVLIPPGSLHHEPEAAELTYLRRAAPTMNPWKVFRCQSDDEPLDENNVASYVSAFLGPEWVAVAQQRLSPPTTALRLDRWVYDTILADRHLAERFDGPPQDPARLLDGWWSHDSELPLVLLPTRQQWLAPAWVGYYGASLQPKAQPAWAAALFQWQQRWGVELVAALGTSLHLVVSRQPPRGDPAWEVAGQIKALGKSVSDYQWQIALHVTRSRSWSIHDRP